jgi:hypothetical protein
MQDINDAVAEAFGQALRRSSISGVDPAGQAYIVAGWLENLIAEKEIARRNLQVSEADIERWIAQDSKANFESKWQESAMRRNIEELRVFARLLKMRIENPAQAEAEFKKQLDKANHISQGQWESVKNAIKTKADLEAFEKQIPKDPGEFRSKYYANIAPKAALREKLEEDVAGLTRGALSEQELLRWYWEVYGVSEIRITKVWSSDPLRLWKVCERLGKGEAVHEAIAAEGIAFSKMFSIRPTEETGKFNEALLRLICLPAGGYSIGEEGPGEYLLNYVATKTFRVMPAFAEARSEIADLVFHVQVRARYRNWLREKIRANAKISDSNLAKAVDHWLRR